jgi:hypothetical protein
VAGIKAIVIGEFKEGSRRMIKIVPSSYTPMSAVKGYVTDLQSALGRTPEQLASILGVASLAKGATVYEITPSALQSLQPADIGLRGYTRVPADIHRTSSRTRATRPARVARNGSSSARSLWSR